MTVSTNAPGNLRVYSGLSTDSKPTVANVGDVFIETDTQIEWTFYGPSGWLAKPLALPEFFPINNGNAIFSFTNQAAVSGNSGVYQNVGYKGIRIGIVLTAVASGTFTLGVQAEYDSEYQTVLSSAALAAVGLTSLLIYPSAPVVANASQPDVLAPNWRLTWTVGGTGTISAKVYASLVP